jgi:hypothetical protein
MDVLVLLKGIRVFDNENTKSESSIGNAVLNKNRAMDNVQKVNKSIDIPSSRTFGTYTYLSF